MNLGVVARKKKKEYEKFNVSTNADGRRCSWHFEFLRSVMRSLIDLDAFPDNFAVSPNRSPPALTVPDELEATSFGQTWGFFASKQELISLETLLSLTSSDYVRNRNIAESKD